MPGHDCHDAVAETCPTHSLRAIVGNVQKLDWLTGLEGQTPHAYAVVVGYGSAKMHLAGSIGRSIGFFLDSCYFRPRVTAPVASARALPRWPRMSLSKQYLTIMHLSTDEADSSRTRGLPILWTVAQTCLEQECHTRLRRGSSAV